MSITTKKINNVKVKKVLLPTVDSESIKGFDMIPDLYANVFLCAKKKSGKTTVLFNILKKCIDKNTKVYFFVSTFDRDATYQKIREWLEDKEIPFEYHLSMYSDSGQDILEGLIKNFLISVGDGDDKKTKDNDEDEIYGKIIAYDENDNEIKIRIRKPKKVAPEICFVFDDLSSEIRNSKSLRRLLKMNRHIKSKCIVSSQFVSDLYPDSRQQTGVWLLFGGHSPQKLLEIYESSDPSVSYEDFLKAYKFATAEKYNFLMIDSMNGEFRKNFDTQILFNQELEE